MTDAAPEPTTATLDRLLLAALAWETQAKDGDLEGQVADPSSGLYPTLLGIFRKDFRPDLSFDRDGWTFDKELKPAGAWIPGDALPPRQASTTEPAEPLALRANGRAAGFGAVVGILDTAICPHPALAGCYVAPGAVYRDAQELDVVEPKGLDPSTPHATFLAGIIAQQAPAARILVRRVISQGQARLQEVLEGLVELKEAGAQVINLSLGTFTDDDQKPDELDLVLRLLGPEIVLIAAAGNRRSHQESYAKATKRPGRPWWPAALEGVVAVGSARRVDENDWEPSEFSNRGPWVNVWAPGEGVESTFVDFPEDGPAPAGAEGDPRWWKWAAWDGTSFAAAVVSGRIAQQISARAADGTPVTAWQAFTTLVRDAPASVHVAAGDAGGTTVIEPVPGTLGFSPAAERPGPVTPPA